MPLSFALSISHFVSSVGADAGFAALIGLAILVLLYFGHARETSNLRSDLQRATQRLEELERRLSAGVSPSHTYVAPRPPMAAPGAEAEEASLAGAEAGEAGLAGAEAASPPPTAAAPVAGAGAGVGAPHPEAAPALTPPAGVGAPPLTDATRVVPAHEQEGSDSEEAPSAGRPAEAPVAAVPLAAPQGTGAGPSATVAGAEAPPSPGPSRPDALGGDRPPPVVAPPPGVGRTPAPVTAAAGGNGTSALGTARGAPRSLLEHGLPSRHKSLRWLIPLVAALVLVAIAVVLIVVLTSNGSTTSHRAAVRHAQPKVAAAPSGISPGAVTVAVVNGTAINQLAHHVGDRLTRLGFKEGALGTATGQTLSTTSVGYLPGYRKDGLLVAHALKLPATSVRPAAQSSLSLVCPQPTSCTADVVVVAGTDLAPKH